MKIGISLPQVGRQAGPDAVQRAAVLAEARGYDSVWVLDRVLMALEPRSPYPASPDGRPPELFRTAFDPIGCLTVAAMATTRVRVGTSVLIAPLYPPVLLARSLTTLDHVSDGRLDVGLGLGWSLDEYEACGVEQRDLGGRLEECLDVLAAVWGPDPVAFEGPRVRIAPSTVSPKPVQRSGPPVLLAAYTPAGLARVGRRADGWNPAGLPVELLAPMWAMVRDEAAAAGRDPDALRLVVRANGLVTDAAVDGDRPTYVGSLEQVAADLRATRDAGADEVVLGLVDEMSSIEEMVDTYDALTAAADLAPVAVP
jgi:probable F420-dependent oxidoreductase